MNENYRQYRRGRLISIGCALLWVLFFFAVTQIVSIVTTAVLFVTNRPSGLLGAEDTFNILKNIVAENNTFTQFICDAVFLLIVAVILAIRRGDAVRNLGISKTTPSTLALCCLFGASANIFFSFAVSVIPWPDSVVNSFAEKYSAIENPSSLLMNVLIYAVITAIVEELVFRALVISELSQSFGRTGCIVISAAIFAAAHLNIVAALYTFVIGIFLSSVYFRYASVWPGVVIHMFFNIVGVLMCEMPPDLYLGIVLIATALAILSSYLLLSDWYSGDKNKRKLFEKGDNI